MRNRYRKLSFLELNTLCVIAAVFALSSFSACGGLPLSGTSERSLTRDERLGIAEVQIEVIVLTENAHTVAGLEVSTETSQTTDIDTTNSDGKAVVNVALAEIDSIEFYFRGKGIDWTETIHDFPKGKSKVRATFILDKIGRVRLRAYEF